MLQDYKAGDYLVIEGPNWFPFKHQYVVERDTETVGTYAPVQYTELRLAEYHGDQQASLRVSIKTGLAKLDCQDVTVPVTVSKFQTLTKHERAQST